MPDTRANFCSLIVGRPRTGKTTATLAVIERYHGNVIVVDEQGEEGYAYLPPLTLQEVGGWRGKGRLTGMVSPQVLQILDEQARNCLLVFEDSSSYLPSNLRLTPVGRILVGRRHRNVDLVFTMHSLRMLPPMLSDMCNYIQLHKTNEVPENLKSRLPNYGKLLAAFNKVQKAKNEYEKILINIQ